MIHVNFAKFPKIRTLTKFFFFPLYGYALNFLQLLKLQLPLPPATQWPPRKRKTSPRRRNSLLLDQQPIPPQPLPVVWHHRRPMWWQLFPRLLGSQGRGVPQKAPPLLPSTMSSVGAVERRTWSSTMHRVSYQVSHVTVIWLYTCTCIQVVVKKASRVDTTTCS